MKFIVRWRDGTETSGLTYDESMQAIKDRDGEWASVRSELYGKDCSEDNVKLKQQIWGGKKHGR